MYVNLLADIFFRCHRGFRGFVYSVLYSVRPFLIPSSVTSKALDIKKKASNFKVKKDRVCIFDIPSLLMLNYPYNISQNKLTFSFTDMYELLFLFF